MVLAHCVASHGALALSDTQWYLYIVTHTINNTTAWRLTRQTVVLFMMITLTFNNSACSVKLLGEDEAHHLMRKGHL